jgi:hypothetical protein
MNHLESPPEPTRHPWRTVIADLDRFGRRLCKDIQLYNQIPQALRGIQEAIPPPLLQHHPHGILLLPRQRAIALRHQAIIHDRPTLLRSPPFDPRRDHRRRLHLRRIPQRRLGPHRPGRKPDLHHPERPSQSKRMACLQHIRSRTPLPLQRDHKGYFLLLRPPRPRPQIPRRLAQHARILTSMDAQRARQRLPALIRCHRITEHADTLQRLAAPAVRFLRHRGARGHGAGGTVPGAQGVGAGQRAV